MVEPGCGFKNGLWKSCWQFEYAIPNPTPLPNITGHGRPFIQLEDFIIE